MNLEKVDLNTLNESKITEWLKQKVKKKVGKVKTTNLKPGRFYSFDYDSKLFSQEKLFYYDTTPLILLLSQKGNYMLGLNFHYLPIKIRQKVISRLKKRYPIQWTTDKLLPNVKWDNIKGELKYESFMVKLYIKDGVRTIVNISNTQMEQLIRIRSEEFTGKKPETIWKNLGLK